MMFNLCAGSGYGRCKIANLINSQGIYTRDGNNWHEATVGHILHNITYMGILRSEESQQRSDLPRISTHDTVRATEAKVCENDAFQEPFSGCFTDNLRELLNGIQEVSGPANGVSR